MRRSFAVELIEEIVNACKDLTCIGGYEVCTLKPSSKDVKKIVVLATLNDASRKVVQDIVTRHKLEMIEEEKRFVICEPSGKSVVYLYRFASARSSS